MGQDQGLPQKLLMLVSFRPPRQKGMISEGRCLGLRGNQSLAEKRPGHVQEPRDTHSGHK